MSAPSPTNSRLAFAILGPLRVTNAGAAVALGGRQQRAVLARLLVAGAAGASVEQLADMLWSERPPSGFVTTIQTYVFHLRKLLEPERSRGTPGEVLVTENGRYRLAIPSDATDVVLFKRAVEAGQQQLAAGEVAAAATEMRRGLALWRGEVLADLADLEFVAPFAARLNEQRLAAIEAVFDCELVAGHHAAVIGDLDELIALHPLREQLYERRMLALYRAGRQSEALNSFDQLRGQLRDELGVDPGEPVQRLQRQVLAHDPSLDVRPVPSTDDVAVSAPLLTDTEPRSDNRPDRRPWYRQRRWVIGSCAVVVASAVAATSAVVLSQTPRSSLRTFPPNSVGVIASNGSLHDAVATGQNPGGVAYGAGSIWVTNTSDGTVSRIDPRSRAVTQTVRVHAQPVGIAASGEDVWVANSGDSSVSRINARENDVVQQRIVVGNLPSAIAAGPSGVWVANSADDTIQRIDPVTGTAGDPIRVGAGPAGLAVDAHSVWVANGRAATVTRVDADASPAKVVDDFPVGAGPAAIAVTPTAVWVANQLDLTVDRLDPATGRRLATVIVGDGPSSILATSSTVWVANEFDGTVTQIDPTTSKVRRKIALGTVPAGLALAGSTVWVANRAFAGAGHVGGTLTVLAPEVPGEPSVDPNDSYTAEFAEVERAVYDGLVAFRPTGGVAGLTLVPDLATRIPRPTPDGKTYAFTLRPGIRYSNGGPVQASDFRRSLERALVLPNGDPRLFANVVGAQHCIDRSAKPCDLSDGVETNDKTGRVIFHLLAPDSDFLYSLSRFVYAIPPTAPPATELTAPPPGTGPYKIVSYVKNKGFTLVRNPYFRQWSFAAQPGGYPDVIQWEHASSTQAMTGVLSGAGDAYQIGGGDFGARTGQVLEDLHRQHTTQLRTDPSPDTGMERLNTRVPPFDKVLARQAVNYATDRNELVQRLGGAQLATPTCQLLPPNFPGYDHNCPFDLKGADGRYAGPDLDKAKALVARSGTFGAPVTVDVFTDPRFGSFTTYFAELLQKLRYRVTVRTLDPSKTDVQSFYRDPRHKVQIAWGADWLADFPTPYNFYGPLFSCDRSSPTNPVSLNLSGFCDRGIDQIAERAHGLDATDPAAAKELWQDVDRKVTNAAPVIFTTTGKSNTLISRRVGNYTHTLLGQLLFDQMWVQ
jgi:YVTN family beta-propeller protein